MPPTLSVLQESLDVLYSCFLKTLLRYFGIITLSLVCTLIWIEIFIDFVPAISATINFSLFNSLYLADLKEDYPLVNSQT